MSQEELKESDYYKVFLIGDPHFKISNELLTNEMTVKIVGKIIEEKPDLTVVLGDILDTHSKIDLATLSRAVDFLRKVKNVSKHLVVLIGNHDRCNNTVFMDENHPFTAMKDWDKTTVVDRVMVRKEEISIPFLDNFGIPKSKTCNIHFLLMPYVHEGRLHEALETIGLSMEDEKNTYPIKPREMTASFAHQEFANGIYNGKASTKGDKWPSDMKMTFSGHLHDFHEVGSNIVYVGTPYQVKVDESQNKAIMIAYFRKPTIDEISYSDSPNVTLKFERYKRISLGLPKMIQVTLTPEELMNYIPPENTHVKIMVKGDPSVTRKLEELSHVKKLQSTVGIRIQFIDAKDSSNDLSSLNNNYKTNISYRTRLITAISNESADLRKEFENIFNIKLDQPKLQFNITPC